MLKRAIRRAIQITRHWLEEDKKNSKNRDYDKDESSYPWLNSLFERIVAEPGIEQHPAYAWGVLQSINLAKTLEIGRVSIIEFGVAGGRGLILLEKIAERVESLYGVSIEVYGFDTGSGLPKPQDYRDLPNLYTEGYYPMNIQKLQKKLTRARLILGAVEETIPKFIEANPPPVAFISFDLDLYSSTKHAFKLLDADQKLLLPRVHCYFDDIMGFTFSDYNGERLAISEFNASHELRKISPIYGLKYFVPPEFTNSMWVEMFYTAHIFDNNLYGHPDGLVKRAVLDIPDE